MIIIVVLALLVPALICVLCYEKFRGCVLTWERRGLLLLIFAFLINLGTYTLLWLRGWEMLSWTLSADSSAVLVPVVVQYMAISLVESVVMAYVLSLVRIGKSRPDEAATGEETENPDADAIETDNS